MIASRSSAEIWNRKTVTSSDVALCTPAGTDVLWDLKIVIVANTAFDIL